MKTQEEIEEVQKNKKYSPAMESVFLIFFCVIFVIMILKPLY